LITQVKWEIVLMKIYDAKTFLYIKGGMKSVIKKGAPGKGPHGNKNSAFEFSLRFVTAFF
jgi:hypothetical protein